MEEMNDKKGSPARHALTGAITARDAACNARDAAKSALARADQLLTQTKADAAKALAARNTAEVQQSADIAKALAAGKAPITAPSDAVRHAGAALAESDSKSRVAKQARDALADDLSEAEAVADRAERAVVSRARDVLAAEVAPLFAKMTAAQDNLIAAYDKLIGLARLGMYFPGGQFDLPASVMAAIYKAQGIEAGIGIIRPPRAGNVDDPATRAAISYRDFLAALQKDADAQLADIPPEPETPLRRVPLFNEIEASRAMPQPMPRPGNAAA